MRTNWKQWNTRKRACSERFAVASFPLGRCLRRTEQTRCVREKAFFFFYRPFRLLSSFTGRRRKAHRDRPQRMFRLCGSHIQCRFGLSVCHRNYVITATNASTNTKKSKTNVIATAHFLTLPATTTSTWLLVSLGMLDGWMLVCFRHNNNNSRMKEIYVVMWCGDCCVRVCERTRHH